MKYYRHCARDENMKGVFFEENSDYNKALQPNNKFDLSWLPSGADRKMKRSQNISIDIVTVQSAFRKQLAQQTYCALRSEGDNLLKPSTKKKC